MSVNLCMVSGIINIRVDITRKMRSLTAHLIECWWSARMWIMVKISMVSYMARFDDKLRSFSYVYNTSSIPDHLGVTILWSSNQRVDIMIVSVAIYTWHLHSSLKHMSSHFNYIFVNENHCILMKTSLIFVLKCPTAKKPTWVKVIVWHCRGIINVPCMNICTPMPPWVIESSYCVEV